jgi:hypothetical protein
MATLSAMVAGFLQTRAPGWLVLAAPEANDCALRAVQFYAGYGPIRSLNGTDPITDLSTVDLTVVLTPGEWSIIFPLFLLYLEFENAQRLEASESDGVQKWGRSSETIKQDIDKLQEDMPKRAFVYPAEILGFEGTDQVPDYVLYPYGYPYPPFYTLY